jgi:hypothetical protein
MGVVGVTFFFTIVFGAKRYLLVDIFLLLWVTNWHG